jgi:hypothetical protein
MAHLNSRTSDAVGFIAEIETILPKSGTLLIDSISSGKLAGSREPALLLFDELNHHFY